MWRSGNWPGSLPANCCPWPKSARQRINTSEAVKLLRAIPESARDADGHRFAGALRRDRLVAARYPPFAGGGRRAAGHHQAVAAARPDNPNSAKYAEEVEKRLAAAVNHPKMLIPTWAKSRKAQTANPRSIGL